MAEDGGGGPPRPGWLPHTIDPPFAPREAPGRLWYGAAVHRDHVALVVAPPARKLLAREFGCDEEDIVGFRVSNPGIAISLGIALDAVQDEQNAAIRDRKSVVEGKSVSVRVDLGGRRTIKKKNR